MTVFLFLHPAAHMQSNCKLSLYLNGHFAREPGSAGIYWRKEWWKWWWQLDYWSYKSCKAPVRSSPTTNQHSFLQSRCTFCRPTNSVKALKGKYHISWTCLSQAHLGSSNFVTDHYIYSSWLPWGRVAMPLISPLMPIL